MKNRVELRAVFKSSAAACGMLVISHSAFANPLNGQVQSGSASITSASSTTKIDQTSEGVVIDWSSFNIGSGQTTTFTQPNAQALAVNRIGGKSASQIFGSLDANGRMVLINGNGLLFGQGSQVNVGSLVATSSSGSNAALLAGKFTTPGSRTASVVNRGAITASNGGLVALVAPSVSNVGTVNAKLGTVALGGANQFTVDFAGDGLVSFTAASATSGHVSNSGSLNGATVTMTARSAEGLAAGVVNMGGKIQAQGVNGAGGSIILDAGNGGAIHVTGALNASGSSGGTILVGGDIHGGAIAADDFSATAVQDAGTNSIAKSATIAANGSAGTGGNIVIWSNGKTEFEGSVSARGTTHGGFAEVSSHGLLGFTGVTNLSAASGAMGTLLLDPENVTISSAATQNGSITGGTFDPTGNNSVLNVSDLEAALATSSVEVTTGTVGSQEGNITVAAAIDWTSGNKLTLDAAGKITIDASVSGGGAALDLIAGRTISSNSAGALTADTLTVQSKGDVTLNAANLIENLGSVTTGVGSFSLTDSETLVVADAVNTRSGDITLTTTGAGDAIDDHASLTGNDIDLVSAAGISGGTVDATTLTGSSNGSASFYAKIENLGAFSTSGGSLYIYDARPSLTIDGEVETGSDGLIIRCARTDVSLLSELIGGTVEIFTSGNLESSGSGEIDATRFYGNASQGISLDGTNMIADVGPLSTRNTTVSLTDGESLTVTGGIHTGSGNVLLKTTIGSITTKSNITAAQLNLESAGTITESGGKIDATELLVSSDGAAIFDKSNLIASLGPITTTSGSFFLTNEVALAVDGTLNGGTGDVTLKTLTGDLDLSAAVEGSTLDFISAGAIFSLEGGLVSAAELEGSAVDQVSLTGANSVAALENFSAGKGGFSLGDDMTLVVAGAVDAGTGDLTLTTSGKASDLTIRGTLEGGTIDLSSGRNMKFYSNKKGSYAVTATTLNLTSGGNAEEISGGTISAGLLDVSAVSGISLADDNDITTVGTDHTDSGPNVIVQH